MKTISPMISMLLTAAMWQGAWVSHAAGQTAPSPASATQAAQPGPAAERARTLRVYDVRDLLLAVGADASKPEEHAAAQAQLMEQLLALIRETIAPESWRAAGARTSIRPLLATGQIIVAHQPEVHAQIAELLQQLAQAHAVQVIVECRLLVLDAAKLPAEVASLLETGLGKPGAQGAYLDDVQVEVLLKAAAEMEDASTATAPRLTLMSGQPASLSITTSRSYVADHKKLERKAEFGAGMFGVDDDEFEPVLSQAKTGMSLRLTATASADRRQATVLLRPTITRLAQLKPTEWSGNVPGMETRMVEQPVIESVEFEALASIPDNATLLLRPAIVKASKEDAAPAAWHSLFILVKPTIVVPPRAGE
jgi:hypothetical protein